MARLVGRYEVEWIDGEEPMELMARQEEGVEALSKALKMASSSPIAGEEVAWPRADGYARYLVAKERPLELIHLAVGDAWRVEKELIRGLRGKDVRQMVAQRKALSSIFASPNEEPGCEHEILIEAGIEAAQAVVDNWSEGDLAGAVRELEDWAVRAADYIPDQADVQGSVQT